jgi:predicted MFS family arabinose efflux permease
MQAYLGDRVPYERRGLALAVTELGWSMAFIAGIPMVGFLISRYGWVSPFGALSLLGLAAVLLLTLMISSTPGRGRELSGVWKKSLEVLQCPPALFGLTIGILATVANEVVNLVFGVWLEDSFGLQILALGGAAAIIGLAELGGEALMGGLTDRLGKERSVGIGLVANCLAVLFFPFLGRSLPGSLIGLFLFYITFEFTLVSIIPMMTEVLPSARVTLMAFNVAGFSIGRAIGALFALPLYNFGILGSVVAAVVFNLMALYALMRLLAWDKQSIS